MCHTCHTSGPLSRLLRHRLRLEDGFLIGIVGLGLLLVLCVETNPFLLDGWYQTQHAIFAVNLGADNYTPIAAPGFLYYLFHQLSTALGFDIRAELILMSSMQVLMLTGGTLLMWQSFRQLGVKRIGPILSFALMLTSATTFMTHIFMSETTVFLLACWTVRQIVVAFSAPSTLDLREACRHSFWLAVPLSLWIQTRMVPLLLLPLVVLLLFARWQRRPALAFSLVLGLATAAYLVGTCYFNYLRFGRFELTNSQGRHLWNSVTTNSDTLLAGSQLYEALKKAQPGIQGKPWWEVEHSKSPQLQHFDREQLLRELSRQTMWEHPLEYLQLGLKKNRRHFTQMPWTFGRYILRLEDNNPAGTDSYLKPIWEQGKPFQSLLLDLNQFLVLWGPQVVYFVLVAFSTLVLLRNRTAFFLGLLITGPFLGWFFHQSLQTVAWVALLIGGIGLHYHFQANRQIRMLMSFALAAYILPVYASIQIEEPTGRVAIPYLPFLTLGLGLLLSHLEKRAQSGDAVAAERSS